LDSGFSAVFDICSLPRQIWQAICDAEVDGRCRLPGFPSAGAALTGCMATIIEADPERLLRLRKDDAPCAGTEITLRLSPANAGGWPTRLTLTQTGFGAPAIARDAMTTHWRQIVADFRLFLEHTIVAPSTRSGPDLGIVPRQTDIGVECAALVPGGSAARHGIAAGDLLLSVRGIRIYDIAQLRAVLATTSDSPIELVWVHDKELRSTRV